MVQKQFYHLVPLLLYAQGSLTGLPLRRRGASDNGLDCQNSVLSVLRGDRTPTASSPYDSATVARVTDVLSHITSLLAPVNCEHSVLCSSTYYSATAYIKTRVV